MNSGILPAIRETIIILWAVLTRVSAVYLAAVKIYLATEVLELTGNAARVNKKIRIIPRHLQPAIRKEEELNNLLSSVTMAKDGVLPNTEADLLPMKAVKKP